MRTNRAPIALVTATILIGTSVWVYAQSGPGTGNAVIPYQGRIENNGLPLEGPTDLRVALFTSAGADTSCLSAAVLGACGVWTQEFASTPVAAGNFALRLGDDDSLGDDVFANDALFLGVAVNDGSSWVALGGLQAIASVPHAIRTETANELIANSIDVGSIVADNLTVVGGTLRLGSPALAVSKVGNTVQVDAPLTSQATRLEGGTATSYIHTSSRYLVIAPYTSQTPAHSYTAIPNTIMRDYCGDVDGCRITLRMKNWENNNLGRNATSMSFHFNYGTEFNNGGPRVPWRREETYSSAVIPVVLESIYANGGVNLAKYPASGVDGDGVTVFPYGHVAQNHDCHFTDSLYAAGTNILGDGALGMGLLNWSGGNGYTAECQLIIDD